MKARLRGSLGVDPGFCERRQHGLGVKVGRFVEDGGRCSWRRREGKPHNDSHLGAQNNGSNLGATIWTRIEAKGRWGWRWSG